MSNGMARSLSPPYADIGSASSSSAINVAASRCPDRAPMFVTPLFDMIPAAVSTLKTSDAWDFAIAKSRYSFV
jgi:hypothetical protein